MKISVISAALVLALYASACGDEDTGSDSPTPTILGSGVIASPPGTGETAEPAGAGRWTVLTPMPTPRTEVAVAAADGLIYVVGGFEASGIASRKVEVYDPATDTWSDAPPLPEPRHHAGAVGWGHELLVIGGYSAGFDTPDSTVYRYDSETELWGEEPPLNEARGGAGTTLWAGAPMVVGGAGADGRSLASAEYRDVGTKEWRPSRFHLATARDHLAAAGVTLYFGGDEGQNTVFAVGGRRDIDFGRNVEDNESFSHPEVEWETVTPIPTARSGIAAAVLGSRIFVFGGEGTDGTFDETEVFDPEANTWETLDPMPTARHGLGAAVVDDVIYVIGGGPTPGLSVTGANEAFRP